jgi:hypothetical protein
MSGYNRIYVDSRDKTMSTETASNFHVRLGNGDELIGATGISLVEATVPLTYNIIKAGVNNLLYFEVQTWNSTPAVANENAVVATIPEGSYNTDELLVILKTQMDAAWSAAYPAAAPLESAWSYSTHISKFTVSSANLQYNFKDNAEGFWDAFIVWDEAMMTTHHPTVAWRNTMNYMLGFQSLTYPVYSVPLRDSPIKSFPLSSSEIHHVYGMDYLFIMLSGLVRDSICTAANNIGNSILAKIPVSSFTGEIQFFNRDSPIVSWINQRVIEELHIRVMDPWFQEINFEGGNISFTLAVHRDPAPEHSQL